MKFLIVTNHSYMFWQFRRELIESLLQKGEVVISTPFTGHEKDFMEIGCRCIETKLERRGMNPWQEGKLLIGYWRLIRKEKPDMVITYSIKPNLYAGFLCRIMKIPYAANVQGLGTAFQNEKMAAAVSFAYRIALKSAQTVFFENKGNARVFLQRRILPRRKITLLHGAGVNLEQYPCKPYPSEKEGIRFLYLGRIMKEKGMDELFPVMRLLKEEYGERIQFDFVGFFEDDYKDTVTKMDQEGVLHFYGFQEDPKPYYAAAHCIVLPSWHEGMSNVLLEGAATGRALICSDIPGCREAVEDRDNGFLVTVKDRDSLYSAMKAFVELSPEERESMGKRGRRRMEKYFDRAGVVRTVLHALNI